MMRAERRTACGPPSTRGVFKEAPLVLLAILALVLVRTDTVRAGHSPAEWRQRTIYQVLTDRFALPSGGQAGSCGNLGDYCGGTWSGLQKRLPYIQGMGFDAIWISPVVANTAGGYHGYWASNLSAVNPHFGTDADLQSLVAAAHKVGMWVMVDVVGNHMGGSIGGVSSLWPFNQNYHYHDCNGCPSDCGISNFDGGYEEEHCRLAGLPDLNQDNQWVADQLRSWVASLVKTYNFDGVRVDTVPEVKKDFWKSFNAAAGVYAVGEVFNGDMAFVGPYQGAALDGILSYPLFYALRHVLVSQQGFNNLQQMVEQYPNHFSDPTLLGTFVENHDNPRFLNDPQADAAKFKNALAFVLMSTGIPIVYYGAEQSYSGGGDPNCRESLWQTGYNTDADVYKFLKAANVARQQAAPWSLDREKWILADDQCGAFSRGSKLILFMTNVGQNGGTQSRTLQVGGVAGDGTTYCDALTQNCFTVANGGQLNVQSQGGMPLLLIAKQ